MSDAHVTAQREQPPSSWPADEVTEVDRAAGWQIDDAVIRLRKWATDDVYLLPHGSKVTIGASDACGIELDDASGHHRISRLHARLVHHEGSWRILDLGSQNGIRVDGVAVPEAVVTPGVEIGIGGITLVAESSRLAHLRAYLARILGRDDLAAVDLALRAIRMAAARRSEIILRGRGDMVPIARAIHRLALGAGRPFIVCDPRRRRGGATARSAENYEAGMPALAAATGGSLCVRRLRMPRDVGELMAALRSQDSRVVLMVCSTHEHHDETRLDAPIVVPDLATRTHDIDQIITEYAEDAIAEYATNPEAFDSGDRDWVREHSSDTLPDIEKGTTRLVAINSSKNVTTAAARLCMAPVSLIRWIGRRKLPR